MILRCKQDNGNMAGDVAINEREADSRSLRTKYRPLIRINKEKTGLEEINVCSTDIGDLCKVETTVDGQRVLLVSIYLSNGTTLRDKMEFFERCLLKYSIKLKGLFLFVERLKLYDLPIIMCGDFNIDFRSNDGMRFLQFMNETFGCTLNNSLSVSTTRNMTCIDGVFTRNVYNAQTMDYVSNFSHHRPPLSITSHDDQNTPAVTYQHEQIIQV